MAAPDPEPPAPGPVLGAGHIFPTGERLPVTVTQARWRCGASAQRSRPRRTGSLAGSPGTVIAARAGPRGGYGAPPLRLGKAVEHGAHLVGARRWRRTARLPGSSRTPSASGPATTGSKPSASTSAATAARSRVSSPAIAMALRPGVPAGRASSSRSWYPMWLNALTTREPARNAWTISLDEVRGSVRSSRMPSTSHQ